MMMLSTIFLIPFVLLAAFLVLGFLAQCLVGFSEILEIFAIAIEPAARFKQLFHRAISIGLWLGVLFFGVKALLVLIA